MDKLINKYNNNNMEFKTIECFECNGNGEMDGPLPECSKPASECCGGCYKQYTCVLCAGMGTLYAGPENHEMFDYFLMLEAYKKMRMGYKKTLKDFAEMIKGVSENGLLEMELMLDQTHKVQLGIIKDQLKRIEKHTEVLQNEIRKQYE